jgi:HAMP domain-containing protein
MSAHFVANSMRLGVLALLLLATTQSALAEVLSNTTSRGPVEATVRLEPSEPLIGDAIHLEIEVLAEAEVEVLMPEFGEALDRFLILDFVPSEGVADDGRNRNLQRYTLEPPHSGEHSIPPLLIEFVDRRPGAKASPDGSDAYEVLTERVDFTVQSVLPENASGDLRPMPGRLSARGIGGMPYWMLLVALLVVLLIASPFLYRAWVARTVRERQRSAYQIARGELDTLLEGESRPDAENIQAFYVMLSGIIRRYLEDRFDLRSPELTTEEFLAVASKSPDLSLNLRSLLGDFLTKADLVKFAGLRPAPDEIEESIAAARRFLEETRAPEDTAVATPAQERAA